MPIACTQCPLHKREQENERSYQKQQIVLAVQGLGRDTISRKQPQCTPCAHSDKDTENYIKLLKNAYNNVSVVL